MKAKRAFFMLLVLLLFGGTIYAEAASLSASAANLPWFTNLLNADQTGVMNLSTAFVGSSQVPMLSYSKTGTHRIFQAHAATSAVAGNCGPNNTWYCSHWDDSALVTGTVSQMATLSYLDTHAIKWAYSTGSMIRGATVELMNDMSFVDDSWQDLIQISKFGSTLIGTPSLQAVGGHYVMAVTIRDSSDQYGHKLVYMHYTGNTPKTSCLSSGSVYECEVIDQSYGFNSLGAPSLKVAEDGTVGIAYYKGGSVMYAYPHEPVLLWPSNCGPGGNTWRCIPIYKGTETGTVGTTVKFAFGQSGSDRGITFTYDDTLIPVTLYYAEYVGSGGNCGSDLGVLGRTALRWQCSDLVGLGDFSTGYKPSFSSAMDPDGYPVIAFDHAPSALSPLQLYLVYPKARTGSADPGWLTQKIDGAPTTSVATGAQAALSLSSSGMGFISYLQEEEYEPADIKIAMQGHCTFLPFTVRR
jgi:hypothetical protein